MNEYYECTSCGQVVQGFNASRMIECCGHPDYAPVQGPDEDDILDEAAEYNDYMSSFPWNQ